MTAGLSKEGKAVTSSGGDVLTGELASYIGVNNYYWLYL